MSVLVRVLAVLLAVVGPLVGPRSASAAQGQCFDFQLVQASDYDVAGTTRTDLTFDVTNKCQWAVSYIAIGTGGLTRVAPAIGTYTSKGSGLTYAVEWTKSDGNPGFESIKFNAKGEAFRKGFTERFVITVQGYRSDYVLNFQGHAGSRWETFSTLSST